MILGSSSKDLGLVLILYSQHWNKPSCCQGDIRTCLCSHSKCCTYQCSEKENLPKWLKSQGDWPHASQVVHDTASDGIFDYACAVLNDGLLLLDFRDAIHEGDSEKVLCCWKFLMLYFCAAGHSKYALEAFPFFAKINGVTSPRLQQQLLWSRFVNSKGGRVVGKMYPLIYTWNI